MKPMWVMLLAGCATTSARHSSVPEPPSVGVSGEWSGWCDGLTGAATSTGGPSAYLLDSVLALDEANDRAISGEWSFVLRGAYASDFEAITYTVSEWSAEVEGGRTGDRVTLAPTAVAPVEITGGDDDATRAYVATLAFELVLDGDNLDGTVGSATATSGTFPPVYECGLDRAE